MKLKIGTRKSKLALWQANTVSGLLNRNGVETEIITIETRGDKALNVPIAEIGGKGVFTEEIETLLKNREVDLAVHSAKDMPSELPDGFELVAFTKREKVNDVLISNTPGLTLDRPLTIGTSSVRRTAMLKHFYPAVSVTGVRGNLQTRIKKMESGLCDALMLAYAGVKRMGYDGMIIKTFSEDECVPPVGQGTLAIEILSSIPDSVRDIIRSSLNDPETESRIKAERSFLGKLQGGCSIPAFALATASGESISLTAGLIGLDGKTLIRTTRSDQKENAQELGLAVADLVINNGGKELLHDIRSALDHSSD